jgi:hypothetical protein
VRHPVGEVPGQAWLVTGGREVGPQRHPQPTPLPGQAENDQAGSWMEAEQLGYRASDLCRTAQPDNRLAGRRMK